MSLRVPKNEDRVKKESNPSHFTSSKQEEKHHVAFSVFTVNTNLNIEQNKILTQ